MCLDSGASGAIVGLSDAKRCGLHIQSPQVFVINGIGSSQCVGTCQAQLTLVDVVGKSIRLNLRLDVIDCRIPLLLGNRIHK